MVATGCTCPVTPTSPYLSTIAEMSWEPTDKHSLHKCRKIRYGVQLALFQIECVRHQKEDANIKGEL